ncbi:1-phosphofructokinase family hexose kinase [Motilimonas pumila]|uniref:Phosphofructokinase n=1 Tax=Motilimonas pumila TaxID=2303987 RepID=A0A418YK40_9GAMM|nr:1-phosphofructokinase family hexose kinase [Motilimonas pumila]RJG51326.1 1-phosphofructokinase family hexose kinase [Motilimonas pumila]
MIYTLTMNPALDLEMHIDHWPQNEVARAKYSQVDVGGKGFNVSRMLTQLGVSNTALGIVGGFNGAKAERSLCQQGVQVDLLKVASETRTNVSLVNTQQQQHFKVNQAGEAIAHEDMVQLHQLLDKHLKAGDWWVLAGSLPVGVEPDFYAQLIVKIKQAGSQVILDTSGEALTLGCQAAPDLIKPNLAEMTTLLGQGQANSLIRSTENACLNADSEPMLSIEAISRIAPTLLTLGPAQAIVSLGANGALMVTAESVDHYPAHTVKEANPIGAGDAMVAGLVWRLSEGDELAAAVTYAMACGGATASLAGTTMASAKQIAKLLPPPTH